MIAAIGLGRLEAVFLIEGTGQLRASGSGSGPSPLPGAWLPSVLPFHPTQGGTHATSLSVCRAVIRSRRRSFAGAGEPGELTAVVPPHHRPRGPGTENPNLAFSRAVQLGDTLYVSGQGGTVERTGNLDADLEKEIRSVLDRIQAIVEEAGLTMDDLAWVQVFCTDLALYGKFNDIYRTYFNGPLPARAFVGTSTLLGNPALHFEVMGIAVRP